METIEWSWPGARWWRCDLHVHSPGSSDFSRLGTASAEDWVRAAALKLDVVAVTDHTSGRWFGELRRAAKQHTPNLTVFPGVEVNCNPGIHLVVLFDPASPDDVVASFLGALGIDPVHFGEAEYQCEKSLPDVVAVAGDRGGICVAAHVDGPKGLLAMQPRRAQDNGLQFGAALATALNSHALHALEVIDKTKDVFGLVDGSTKAWAKRAPRLPYIASSDAHQVADIGASFTWIKMSQPTIEGLRLALLDGELSVSPRWQPDNENPNAHAPYVLRGLRTRNAKYLGRSKPGDDNGTVIEFSPWFTAVIGGRGTGKSTVVDLLRSALGRREELPASLRNEYAERMAPPAGRTSKSLVTADTRVSAGAMRARTLFRARWQPTPPNQTPTLELFDGANWCKAEGHVGERLPVRIYSQKQIFELASDPSALLTILDAASQVGLVGWRAEWDATCAAFLTKRLEVRQLQRELAAEPTLKGKLDDLQRQIAVFEKDGNADLLKAWQRSQRQRAAVGGWAATVDAAIAKAEGLVASLRIQELPVEAFDPTNGAEAGVLAETGQVVTALQGLAQQADAVVQQARKQLESLETALRASPWNSEAEDLDERHRQLVEQLRLAGANDPDGYGKLVRERQQVQNELTALVTKRAALATAAAAAEALADKLVLHRRDLSNRRQAFIDSVLVGNPDVRVRVHPYGAAEDAEAEFRKVIGREGTQYERDIGTPQTAGSMFQRLYAGYELPKSLDAPDKRLARLEAFEGRLTAEKGRLSMVAEGKQPAVHAAFATFLKGLAPEVWDRLQTWFPPDDVQVEFRGRDRKWQGVETGSPGQRTAALLSFLLSYGDEPIILDQPEDDLDNQLVYELVVEQIRRIKARRQVIVVTHNPNIVVNGDAECVIALAARGGQTEIVAMGGLQEDSIRRTICDVMEGGRDAFARRWQRIGGRSE